MDEGNRRPGRLGRARVRLRGLRAGELRGEFDQERRCIGADCCGVAGGTASSGITPTCCSGAHQRRILLEQRAALRAAGDVVGQLLMAPPRRWRYCAISGAGRITSARIMARTNTQVTEDRRRTKVVAPGQARSSSSTSRRRWSSTFLQARDQRRGADIGGLRQ